MLRFLVKALASSRCQTINLLAQISETTPKYLQPSIQQYHHLSSVLQQDKLQPKLIPTTPPTGLLQNAAVLDISNAIITRPLTKFSLQKGKRKAVKAVIKRFYRLDWGGWIRTKSGRQKKLWKKSEANKRRLRQHVLVSGTQSWLLDKMVTKFWRKSKYYVDDPYEPYHKREEFNFTKKSPA